MMAKNNSWNMDDDRVVLTDINQQITGDKEFTGLVEVPTPGTIDEAVNLGYIQNNSWNLVTTLTVTTPVADLIFTNIGSWDTYLFYFYGLTPATNGVSLALQCSIDNGTTWITSNNTERWGANGAAVSATSTTGATEAILTSLTSTILNSVHGPAGTIVFPNIKSSGRTMFISESTYVNSTTSTHISYRSDGIIGNGPVNAVRLFFTSGNISAGRVSLYGAM